MPNIETNGVETYYERHGEGPPLVFIHGSGWDHRQWQPQVETLADDYEVITYDAQGHGKTPSRPDLDKLTLSTFVDDLHALITALDLDQPTLVGCSLGGSIALAYAADHPNNVHTVIPLEGAVDMRPTSLKSKIGWKLQLAATRTIGLTRLYKLQLWLSSLLGSSDGDTDTPVDGMDMTKEDYIRDAPTRMDADSQLKLGRGIAESHLQNLDEITAPVLVLTGDDPAERFVNSADTMEQEISDCRRERIPDGGHAANIDNPEAFNQTLRDFLSNIKTEATTPTAPQER